MVADWEEEWAAPMPGSRREIASPSWVFENASGNATPNSDLEALMMTEPNQDPQPVVNHRDDVWENLDKTLGVFLELSEEERDVLSARYVSGLSVRETSDVLGLAKSTVHRIEQSAMARIRRRIDGRNSG